MERAEDEISRVFRRSERRIKRTKYNPPGDNTNENPDWATPSSPRNTTAQPSQEAMLAMASGNPRKPIIVPHPDSPIDINDVDAFLYHFAVVKGIIKEPSHFAKSQEGLLVILTKWNSVYTIIQDKHADAAARSGFKVGNNLAYRCVIKKNAHLLKPLYDYFQGLETAAKGNVRAMTQKDLDEHAEHGIISWFYMQMMQRIFAGCTKSRILKIAKEQAPKFEEELRWAKANAFLDTQTAEAIENRGGIIFGPGGGAYGDYDFIGNFQVQNGFTFKGSEGSSGGFGGGGGGAHSFDFMGEVQLQDEFTSKRAKRPPGGIGGDFFDNMDMS
ncbi:hypothetical protein N431DRAFT_443687 [Stipitochalara longipes BDJ]|nr:hypothetical protein N431DRAFT_443687 [Stipitochalara longipes BDJ]